MPTPGSYLVDGIKIKLKKLSQWALGYLAPGFQVFGLGLLGSGLQTKYVNSNTDDAFALSQTVIGSTAFLVGALLEVRIVTERGHPPSVNASSVIARGEDIVAGFALTNSVSNFITGEDTAWNNIIKLSLSANLVLSSGVLKKGWAQKFAWEDLRTLYTLISDFLLLGGLDPVIGSKKEAAIFWLLGIFLVLIEIGYCLKTDLAGCCQPQAIPEGAGRFFSAVARRSMKLQIMSNTIDTRNDILSGTWTGPVIANDVFRNITSLLFLAALFRIRYLTSHPPAITEVPEAIPITNGERVLEEFVRELRHRFATHGLLGLNLYTAMSHAVSHVFASDAGINQPPNVATPLLPAAVPARQTEDDLEGQQVIEMTP